jgi:hypothetical protein
MARAGDAMPVVMRGRMYLACKSDPNSHADQQQSHHLPGFVGDK